MGRGEEEEEERTPPNSSPVCEHIDNPDIENHPSFSISKLPFRTYFNKTATGLYMRYHKAGIREGKHEFNVVAMEQLDR